MENQIRLAALEGHLFELEHQPPRNETPARDAQVGSSSGREYGRFPLTVSDTIQEIGSLLPNYRKFSGVLLLWKMPKLTGKRPDVDERSCTKVPP